MKKYYLFVVSICISIAAIAQDSSVPLREKHVEIQEDAYAPVSRASMPKSPAYNVQSSNFFTAQVNIDENGMNIVGDAANEPSIAVDPTNPDRIVIGWRQFDTVENNFRQAGYGYSLDGGNSWTFPGVLDPGVFRSDPVLDFDAEGNFFYNSLLGSPSNFECDVFAIRDGGVEWEAPVPAGGGDKQWMRVDHNAGVTNNYAHWNLSFTSCEGSFIRSTDGSESFETCIDVPQDPFWGTLAVNKESILYLAGTNGTDFVVFRSLNAQDTGSTIEWEDVALVDLDGQLNAGVAVNPQGLLGQTWIDVDISNGPGEGNVYVAASVTRNSNSDPGDVMFSRSIDGGITFEDPVRINTDDSTTNVQWLGTMAVAPNGRIDVAWLDTRNAPEGTLFSELYYSFSDDQGVTWSENEVLSDAFDPTIGYPQQNKMGDYFDMVSDNEGVHLAWANTINGGQDVYYTRITPDSVLRVDEVTTATAISGFPNPFTEAITLSFNAVNQGKTSVVVYDILGRQVTTLFDQETIEEQSIIWNGTSEQDTKVTDGIYFVTITTENQREVIRVIKQ
ncbi:T9SS type A sorting domain-containing protein [uncultured Dokdonia sp.]|uniref:T9SS type A sorting domain-containing protein n=1 Tax=uncultured Dokdonia sp. TaxID=575653 RepID=UPI002611E559|nr:T9SS type A sorting domain-containing protein [uncultured Dokdonia sp.]